MAQKDRILQVFGSAPFTSPVSGAVDLQLPRRFSLIALWITKSGPDHTLHAAVMAPDPPAGTRAVRYYPRAVGQKLNHPRIGPFITFDQRQQMAIYAAKDEDGRLGHYDQRERER